MRRFVPAALLCMCFGTSSLAQANRTERIPLRFVSAAEAVQIILPPPMKEGEGGLGPRPARGAVPAGVVALASDAQGTALVATGSRAGLADLRNLVRLFDVPPRPVRLSVTALIPDANLREELKVDLVETDARGEASGKALAAGVDVKHSGRLVAEARRRKGVLMETVLDTANNRLAHFLVPGVEGQEAQLSIQPRVNGDGSITLFLQERVGHSFSIRRIASGSNVILLPNSSLALLVRAETTAPPKK